MKRTRIPGLIDVIKLDSPEEIDEMGQSACIDRSFEPPHPIVNGLILRHILDVLSFRGKRFPTISAKDAPGRAREQNLLWSSLSDKAALLKEGRSELLGLAGWVKGTGNENELGILVQQIVGRAFNQSYTATQESWAAALVLGDASHSINPVMNYWWRVTGKVSRAKSLLASKVNGNLAGVHGTGIALHNVVKAFQHMRGLYIDIGLRSSLSPEDVSRQCLFAPAVVLRQATGDGEIAGCPFSEGSLFIVALADAQKHHESEDVVFLNNSWSRCPGEQWVPALLEGVWRRVTAAS